MRRPHDRRLDEIESLYRRCFPKFLRVTAAMLGDPDRAVEAVQDGFADIVRSRRTFRGEGTLEAWAWHAVVNATRKANAKAAQAPGEDILHRRNGHEPGDQSEVLRLVALLPERQRLTVFLRYYADLDYRTVAGALGVEVGTVSATLNAAHATLRWKLMQEVRQ